MHSKTKGCGEIKIGKEYLRLKTWRMSSSMHQSAVRNLYRENAARGSPEKSG